uniref:CSON007354 protein n=1 Tax=Culicoides sonorensis TaxID=179676 RepID=A0A336LXK6_CULSO
MLGALKRRWKTQRRPQLEDHESDEDQQDGMIPPRFIDVQHGKIYLGPPKQLDTVKDKELLEARIAELEDALLRLQDQFNKSQSTSPVVEKELKTQIETMNRAMRTKERRSMQVCREHKTLQARFLRQETSLATLQHENKSLHRRVRQYELCLDDVMRKVVDAIVAEDNLRDEVTMLKTRVRDLEAQNAALSASPSKGRDEGYCTMSSGQPPPSQEGHLENLPEEPEQWLLSAEPCSAEMEDWSMSQEEMGTALEEESTNVVEWPWNSNNLMTANAITQTDEDFNDLLLEQSDSLQSALNCEEKSCDLTSDDDESNTSSSGHCHENRNDDSGDDDSPTPSEAGRAQVFSCSSTTTTSSESGGENSFVNFHTKNQLNNEVLKNLSKEIKVEPSNIVVIDAKKFNVLESCEDEEFAEKSKSFSLSSSEEEENSVVAVRTSNQRQISNRLLNRSNSHNVNRKIVKDAKVQPCMSWRRSNGWTRVSGQSKEKQTDNKTEKPPNTPMKCFEKISRPVATIRSLPKPPPVPLKRSLGAS